MIVRVTCTILGEPAVVRGWGGAREVIAPLMPTLMPGLMSGRGRCFGQFHGPNMSGYWADWGDCIYTKVNMNYKQEYKRIYYSNINRYLLIIHLLKISFPPLKICPFPLLASFCKKISLYSTFISLCPVTIFTYYICLN